MYLFLGCLLILTLIFILFFRFRRKKICIRIRNMCCEEKCSTLSSLIEPFGYCYNRCSDTFSTRVDAPQRAFGYTALYDRYAPHFHMVFDCLPIYFDYHGHTWLIEFWKGQYAINCGCEVGIYKADSLAASLQRKTTLFHSVTDEEMLPLSLRLFYRGTPLSAEYKCHWWLTIFQTGTYSEPKDLATEVCITFPTAEMRTAFTDALVTQSAICYEVCDLQVRLMFRECSSCELPWYRRAYMRFAQWKNRILCRLFLCATRPFSTSLDRVLYLYYNLPRMFRRIFRDKKRRKCCKKSCRRCRHMQRI